MMGIEHENRIELVDVDNDKMNAEFDQLTDQLLAWCQPLSSSGSTGIGFREKFKAFGVNWKDLKALAFKLMEDGIITKYEDKKGIMRVNLNGLDKLEVGVDKISLICFDSSF